jgi:hypothetical protein
MTIQGGRSSKNADRIGTPCKSTTSAITSFFFPHGNGPKWSGVVFHHDDQSFSNLEKIFLLALFARQTTQDHNTPRHTENTHGAAWSTIVRKHLITNDLTLTKNSRKAMMVL